MSTTLSVGVTELTLTDGSVTELATSAVIDNKPYYDLAFAAAKTYTDAQDVVTLDAAKAFATNADGVVQAHVIQRINHTGTQPVGTITGLAAVATSGLKSDVGLGNVDDTSDVNKPVSTATQTALNAKEASITAGTTGQYWRGDKSWQNLATVATTGSKADVGLSNVDNTSDVNKPVSTAQATADTNTLNSAKSYSDSGDTTTLTSAKSYADSLVVGLFDFRGDYNASGNTYPTSVNNGSGSAGAVLKADVWRIGTQGTLQGKTARVGDLLTSVIDSPGQIDANWTLTANELNYTPENTANKATDLSSNDNTHYTTTAAVQTAINTREPSIAASVVTSFWSGTKTFRDLATDVRDVVLTGLSTATATAVAATDSILIGIGKLQAQVNAKLDANANAVSATKLVTARNINGVVFDGTANITIADSTKEPAITADVETKFWSGTKTFRDLATDVRAVVLTGLSTGTGTAITAADTILSALGKLQNQASANATAITGKEPTLSTSTSAGTYRSVTVTSKGLVTSGTNPTTVAGYGITDAISSAMTTNAQTGTAYTFVSGDRNNQTTTNNAATNTFTIPPVASVAWAVGDILFWRQIGAGQTTFVGGSGVTFRNRHGTLKSLAQYASGAFVYAGSDVWDVTGELAEV